MIKIRNQLFFFSALLLFFCAQAKPLKISSIGWGINIPNQYALADSISSNGRLLLRFKREAILDAQGMQVYPNIGIILETIPDSVGLESFANHYLGDNAKYFQIKKCDSIHIPNALCYSGFYNEINESKTIRHAIFAVYQKKGIAGIQIIFDSTESAFPIIQKEFLSAIRSINIF